MQITKIPADIVRAEEMEYLKDANERQTRQFVALIASRHGRHGVSLVCGILGFDRKTVYKIRGRFLDYLICSYLTCLLLHKSHL